MLRFISQGGTSLAVTTTEAECIEALREAADRLEESPTKETYEELGLQPAASTILRVMGSWNEAKEAAGLETYEQGENGERRSNRSRTGSNCRTMKRGRDSLLNNGGTTRTGSIELR